MKSPPETTKMVLLSSVPLLGPVGPLLASVLIAPAVIGSKPLGHVVELLNIAPVKRAEERSELVKFAPDRLTSRKSIAPNKAINALVPDKSTALI